MKQADIILLRAILESSSDAVAAIDTHYRHVAMNTAYAQKFVATYGMAVATGDNLRDMLAHLPREQATVVAVWGRALAGEHYSTEQDFGADQHNRKIFLLTFDPMFSDDGDVIGAVAVARDVTQRAQDTENMRALNAELEQRVVERTVLLDDSLARLELAYKSAGIGTFELYPDTQTVLVSPQFCYLFNIEYKPVYPLEDLVTLIHEEDRSRLRTTDLVPGADALNYIEYRVEDPETGATRWIARQGEVHTEANGTQRFIGTVYDITERRMNTERIRENAVRLRLAIEAAELGTFDYNLITGQLDWDARCKALFGLPPHVPVTYDGAFLVGLHPDDRERVAAEVARAIDVDNAEDFDVEYRTIGVEDGIERIVAARGRTVIEEGRAVRFVGMVRDVTNARRAEAELRNLNENLEAQVYERGEQLRQAQKMEALGQLTGGIAHDFNNMLTGIIGSLDIAQRRMAAGKMTEAGRFIQSATGSAQRAAALTHRLLAFARRQPLDNAPVDINGLITSLVELFGRTLGERIDFATALNAKVWQATIDASQLENALLNLVINARDAMPDGGKLTIETTNVRLDEIYARSQTEVEAGDYVLISVSDSGVGMSASVIEKAFDPFFTTKPIGQGTGLGLSMIYGFVKQAKGHIRIYSEAGMGTTVKLYLPRYYAQDQMLDEEQAPDIPVALSGETVLVVEDDESVRMIVGDVLEELHYTYLEVGDAAAAIAILASGQRVDLLVTDVGLPGMNGRQLAEVARQLRPDLGILFITGYAETAMNRSSFLEPGMEMIGKPFSIDVLGLKIREMLGN